MVSVVEGPECKSCKQVVPTKCEDCGQNMPPKQVAVEKEVEITVKAEIPAEIVEVKKDEAKPEVV